MNEKNAMSLDRYGIEETYARLEKSVYNIVYRWVWDSEEARDIVQETFVRLWRVRHQVQPETREPFIYRIALNLAANRRRSKRIWRWVTLESLKGATSRSNHGARQFEIAERDRIVRQAVNALPGHLKRVILLSEFSELTYEQIARCLGIPSGTVGSRRNKALQILHKKLANILGESHGL